MVCHMICIAALVRRRCFNNAGIMGSKHSQVETRPVNDTTPLSEALSGMSLLLQHYLETLSVQQRTTVLFDDTPVPYCLYENGAITGSVELFKNKRLNMFECLAGESRFPAQLWPLVFNSNPDRIRQSLCAQDKYLLQRNAFHTAVRFRNYGFIRAAIRHWSYEPERLHGVLTALDADQLPPLAYLCKYGIVTVSNAVSREYLLLTYI